MPETPKNIFVISARFSDDFRKLTPSLLKFHHGRDYKYSLSEYSDVKMIDTFRKKYHIGELEKTIREVLQGKQRTDFDEFKLTDLEIETISMALKTKIEKSGCSNLFPIYVQREETPNACSFPLEMLHTHFKRVW